RRHPPSDLGHAARLGAGRARNAGRRHADRLDRAHHRAVGRRLPGHRRPAMSAPRRIETPMRRVRGLGAARSGTSHFWLQRVTSVAGIPLTIALIVIVMALMGLGMQEIILDYVHEDTFKMLSLMANTFFVVVVTLASAFAILKLSFGVN